MNQAQAMSLENYSILRTISLSEHSYIIDVAYSERGTVFLSVTNHLCNVQSVPIAMNGVRIFLPTGSYINYKSPRFYYIEDDILKSCSPTDCTLKILQNKADKKPFQTHGIAISKFGFILVCQWNRKFKSRALGKLLNYDTLVTTAVI